LGPLKTAGEHLLTGEGRRILQKLEEDLDTVEDLDKQLVRFLKSKDIKMDTVKCFDKVWTISSSKWRTWKPHSIGDNQWVSLKMPPLFALF
jgi:hypothetical protein